MVQIKSGLEIHQQLETHKLFCNCPSILRNDEPDVIFKRKLHAVAGETGKVDVAAKHEAVQERAFIYQGYSDTNCLVEYDDEPPHLMNEEALQIVLHVALHLNCKIMPIVQVMRKTVVDGSNTSGFQRTALIARDGYVETKYGKVGIENIYLEEDSARAVQSSKGTKTFKLDRLGLPLIEIQTAPDIKSPEQAKETALFLGDVLRSCKVRRGIGTIRQDINISIPGHPRVEIKGFQDVKMFITTIKNEVLRQRVNITQRKLRSEVRNALPDGKSVFLRPMPGSARMYPETDLPLLRITRQIINKARRTLPRLRSEVHGEYRKKGLSEEMIKFLSHGDKIEEFEALLKLINDPNFIAKVLFLIPKEVGTREKIEKIDDVITLDVIESIVDAVRKKKIKRENVKHVMTEIAKGKRFDEAIKIESVDISSVETEIAKLIKEKPGLSIGGYMGLVMGKFKGKIDGKTVNSVLQKLLN